MSRNVALKVPKTKFHGKGPALGFQTINTFSSQPYGVAQSIGNSMSAAPHSGK